MLASWSHAESWVATLTVSRSVPLLPSRRESSVEDIVTPPAVTSFVPRARAVAISASDRSTAVEIVAPVPVVATDIAEAMSPVDVLSITKL